MSEAIDRWVWYAGWSDKFTQVLGGLNPVAGPYFDISAPEATGVVAVLAPQRLEPARAGVGRRAGHRLGQHRRGADQRGPPAAGHHPRRVPRDLRRARRRGQHRHRPHRRDGPVARQPPRRQRHRPHRRRGCRRRRLGRAGGGRRPRTSSGCCAPAAPAPRRSSPTSRRRPTCPGSPPSSRPRRSGTPRAADPHRPPPASQLFRPVREGSPSHRNSCGAKVKLPAPGGKVGRRAGRRLHARVDDGDDVFEHASPTAPRPSTPPRMPARASGSWCSPGPAGPGKSRLASRLHAAHGWPIFRLDDFYRDEDDPSMPRSEGLGIIDWDHPDSWDADRAVASLCELVDTGRTDTPVYDISTSRAVGHHEVHGGPGRPGHRRGHLRGRGRRPAARVRGAAQRVVRAPPPGRHLRAPAGARPQGAPQAAGRPWCGAGWP